MNQQENDFVFGLDIGTRNVVGTVGRLQEDGFHVVAQCTREHETRAMIDGQIHNISRVGKVVQEVKECLEAQIEMPLENVCIAAAGRVLRTVTTRVKYEFPEETVVSGEDLHTLNLLGVDKAQQELKEEDEENKKYKFFCVGYSVMHYYLNGDLFTSLEGHKADFIEEDIIVTFLPEDVVDGLYSAVEQAGLQVANLTLEPIAAINVAIPQNFRMLNIALIDVGAGTSDICITKEGSIAAYGMIPYAGDELTEVIVQEYLVDFATAEQIKKDSTEKKEIVFEDIMGISHTIPAEQVWKLTEPVRNKITKAVAEKIKELNGDVSVAAAFVVGGGGKIKGFCESLAKDLGIVEERVALRGEEVMKDVTFEQDDIKKDPLLVTPIGICLNYYEQKNNFIVIHFNDEMMKLYDNGHLTVVDAALQAGYSTEELFPRRGKDIHFTVNGTHRMIRGEQGESAVVRMNDEVVGMNTPLLSNCRIEIQASTAGRRAVRTIESLDEYTSDTVTFIVNRHYVTCPKFVEVNGSLEPGSYEIQENDAIETRNYYTLGQLREFMDVELDPDGEIMVNNRPASMETLVYENFNIEWTTIGYADMDATYKKVEESPIAVAEKEAFEKQFKDLQDAEDIVEVDDDADADADDDADAEMEQEETVSEVAEETAETTEVEEVKNPQDGIDIKINGENFKLQNKEKYIFVDIFNVIDFDINAGGGRRVVTNLNGQKCGYSSELNDGDQIEIYWKES